MMRLLRSVKLLDRGLSQVRYLLPVGHRVSNMARGRWLVGRPLARHYARMRVPVVAPPQADRYARARLFGELFPYLPA